MNLFDLEREKYYGFPSNMPTKKRELLINDAIVGGGYVVSQKFDGNWACFVKQKGKAQIQSRGRSTVTGAFTELQDKVPHIFNDLNSAFEGDTFIIGEIFMPGGDDKTVGSILRCLTKKALSRQKENKLKFMIFDVWYFNGKSLMDTPLINRIPYLDKVKEKVSENECIRTVKYFPASETFDLLDRVFDKGGEGVVLQMSLGRPEPGKRPVRKSIKVKKEIATPIDVFLDGYVKPERAYKGDHLEDWPYWENVKTAQKSNDNKLYEFERGLLWEPISKNYYNGWPGAISCAVWNSDGTKFRVCDVAGLTDDLKESISKDPRSFLGLPLTITGMEFTTDNKIRHPKFVGFRDDINNKDCTYDKIFESL